MDEIEFLETELINHSDFIELIVRFFFNFAVVGLLVGLLYYPRNKRRDYSFTFILISVSIFLMIFLLGSVKIKVGFALGLFAIFGIIRYRTEQMPVREMTYLFIIIAISVINALSTSITWAELIATNVLFLLSVTFTEKTKWILRHTNCKTIKYDRIDLITPEKHDELIEDLKKRTGLNISKVEIGDLDFIKDMAIVRISYEPDNQEVNTLEGASVK